MILSDKDILKEMEDGNIIIDEFKHKHLNPCSYDLTLAPEFKIYSAPILDLKEPNEFTTHQITDKGFILYPNELYLYACNERIGCKKNIRGKVEGKSSLGRLGLFTHVTAGFIDVGFEGSLVLELVATKPIRIYPNIKICQIEFAYTGEVLTAYDKKEGSKYHNQLGVQESKYHLNFYK